MIRCVQDLAYPSGAVVSTATSAFQPYPNIEGFDATVLDDRPFPAPGIAVGTLYVEDFFAVNTNGDAFYKPSDFANQALPLFSYGVVTAIPTQPQGYSPNAYAPGSSYGVPTEVRIRQKGTALALCVTPDANTAIAPGTLLVADGSGNLQPVRPPAGAPTPTVTPFGTTGAATWTYKLAAVSAFGGVTVLGTAGSTGTGNATLTGTNGNLITWTPVQDAAYYIVVRTVSGGTPASVGVIGVVGNGQNELEDVGQATAENTSATVYFPTPAAGPTPTVVQVSGATAGTITWTYAVYSISDAGIWGAISTTGSVATGAATLSPTQGNKITWTAVSGISRYAISRTAVGTGGVPQTTGIIAFANAAQATSGVVDYGQGIVGTAAALTQALPTPQPPNGVVLAKAKGSLAANTTTPTLVAVQIGGF